MGFTDKLMTAGPSAPAGSSDSEFTKGLRGGMAAAKGQLNTLAGTAGELVGADNFAKERYAAAAEAQAEAAAPENTARVGSFRDIGGLRDAFDYGSHMIAGSAPVLGAGLATIAATRGRVNPLVAGTAAATPFTTGGVLEQQQADPEAQRQSLGMRAGTALATGVGQAALMNAVPVAMGGKLLGNEIGAVAGTTAGRVAQNLGEGVVGNAAAGVASEKLGQNAQSMVNPNRDTSKDSEALLEAGVGGAVTGLPFAGLGLAGDTAAARRGRAPRTDGVPIDAAPPAPRTDVLYEQPADGATPPPAAPQAGLLDRIKQTFAAKPDEAGIELGVAEKMARGEETIDPEVLRAASPEQQGQVLKDSDESRMQQVTKWAQDIMQKGELAPEQRAQIETAMADLSDRGNQALVAGVKVAQDLGTKAKSAAESFLSMANEKYEAATKDKKLNDADSPRIHNQIADVIAPALADTFPQLVQNETALNAVTSGLRKTMVVMAETGKVDADTAGQLRDWFGDNAASVMSALHSEVLGNADKAKSTKYFDAVNQLLDTHDAARSSEDLIRSSLPPEVAETVNPKQLTELSGYLREFVNGEHTKDMSPSQATVTNRMIEAELRNQFGDKTDTLLEGFRKQAEEQRAKAETEVQADPEQGINVRDGEPEQDVQYLGGGKKADAPEPVRSPEAHRAEFSNESQAERLMRAAQLDNPDSVVEFKKIKDLDPETQAKYPDAGPDDGLVVVGGEKSETRMSDDEFKSSMIDSSKTSHLNSPSRIDTGVQGAIVDARALVKTMQGKLDYSPSDDISARHRTARAFMEGVAAVQDKLGKTFDIPDKTVIAPGFTYGEAKRLSFREPDPAWMKGKTDEEINTEIGRRDTLKEMNPRQLEQANVRAQDVLAKREGDMQARIAADRAQGIKIDKAYAADLRKSMGVDDARAAVRAAENEIQSRDDAVRKAKNLEDAGQMEVDPNANIVTAATGDNVARKTGLDDNALSYVNSPAGERNVDGGFKPSTINAIDSKINRLENLKSADGKKANLIAQRLGAKARDVFDKFNQMTRVDQAMLAAIVKDGKVSSIAETINPLYEKYKGVTSAKKDNAFVSRVLGEGDLAPTIKEIGKSDDVRTLQRAAELLAEHSDHPRAAETTRAINDRLGALVQDPSVSYNMQRAGATRVSPSEERNVRAHIDKVLGKAVDVEFAQMLHEGEFVRDPSRVPAGMAQDAIKVSVLSQDPMSTAYHESLHAFLAKLGDDGVADKASPLFKSAMSDSVQAKLKTLLAGQADALKQLNTPEEAAAYMYQFWSNGQLEVTGKARGVLARMGEFFRKTLGMWTNDERAVGIMDYFNSGDYAKEAGNRNAVAMSLAEGTPSAAHFAKKLDNLKQMVGPLDTLANRVISTGDAQVRSFKNAALDEVLNKVLSPLQGEQKDVGYLPAARAKRTQVLNALADVTSKYDVAHATDALTALQKGEKAQTPEGRIVQREVRKALDSMYDYMQEAGVKMGDLGYGKDYFPRTWDTNRILANEQGFRDMLQQYKDAGKFDGSIDQIMAALTRADGSELMVETAKPGNQFAKERVLGFIRGEDAQPFLNDNLYQTLNSYVTQGTRRAEWSRRFGDDGEVLKKHLEDARKAGATEDQILTTTKYLKGVDGTLGDNIDPALRRAFGNMMVYQNIRVLPLALFSSLIDPIGISVRGGTAGEAFTAFKRGIREIPEGFKKPGNRARDPAYDLAEAMGTIDSAVLMHTIGTSYSQGMTSDLGRRVNDAFFKYNLMEQYNTSMRVAATESAANFISRHADGTGLHSARWLAELGLKPKDIVKGADGRPVLTYDGLKAAGLSDADAQAKATQMSLAVNKWVDGAVLRPNAAHKPIWMNDPHFALISHLKQFVYSFQETILKRVANEVRHGNIGPAYALASYVPFMIAADLAKGALVSGGGVPSSRENWDAMDYLWSGLQRAGLFGVGQFGIDVAKDIHRGGTGFGALSGPTVDQLGDAASVVAGPQQFKTFALNALPANQLIDAGVEAATTNTVD